MTIRVDAPPVENEEEAYALMVHHLRLAAAYFEGTELAVVGRLAADDLDFVGEAAVAFARVLDASYEKEPVDG